MLEGVLHQKRYVVFCEHLRLPVVSLSFNSKSVNINHGTLPQMTRVEAKHPSGSASSQLGTRLDLSPARRGGSRGTSISGWHSQAGGEHPASLGAAQAIPLGALFQ